MTMDRPGFVEMIRQLEQEKPPLSFVKDTSRAWGAVGRLIEVGRLTTC